MTGFTTQRVVAPWLGLRLYTAFSFSGLCVRTAKVLRSGDTETDERDGDNNRGNEKKTQDRNAALATHHRLVPSWRAQRMPLPTRLNAREAMSSQLNQMKNALPRMWSSGTKPQYRLSSLLSRLSPIIKY